MSRKSTIDGTVTIAIDSRHDDSKGQEHGRFIAIADVLPLMILLQDLCGDQTEVFFDFGVVSLINVDLAKLRERFESGSTP